jgi:hypothetical protein
MARPRSIPALSLFPFLSVLMCAIGLMSIVFASSSITTLNSKSQKFTLIITPEENAPKRPWDDRLHPVYFVCSGDGVRVFFSGRERVDILLPVQGESQQGLATLADVVRRIRGMADHRWAVLLVKPSGVDNLGRVRSLLDEAGLSYGRWPFAEDSSFTAENREVPRP